jgi:hypothetical protein
VAIDIAVFLSVSRNAVFVEARVDGIVKYLASSAPGSLRHATYVGLADGESA